MQPSLAPETQKARELPLSGFRYFSGRAFYPIALGPAQIRAGER
ncbi:MAG TPA: hypothetical protein VFQ35_09445 [Polyangiaceae bacterium]|nr:hypothetical protein [Polyangiaceae bacterium]